MIPSLLKELLDVGDELAGIDRLRKESVKTSVSDLLFVFRLCKGHKGDHFKFFLLLIFLNGFSHVITILVREAHIEEDKIRFFFFEECDGLLA